MASAQLSSELQALLHRIAAAPEAPPPPAPDDLAGWTRQQQIVEGRTLPACVTAIADTGVKLDIYCYGGMATLGITPPDTMHRPPAIFIHGGGYVSFSAYSSLFASAPIACALARPILSLDYPLAPHAHFDSIVPATADAITAIIAEHGSVAIIGDSAGGGLALAAYQQLDDALAREVSAMVLLSPWVALSDASATHKSHRERDPILRYVPGLSAAAAAYAPGNIDHPMARRFFAALSTMPADRRVGGDFARRHRGAGIKAGAMRQHRNPPSAVPFLCDIGTSRTRSSCGTCAHPRLYRFLLPRLINGQQRQQVDLMQH